MSRIATARRVSRLLLVVVGLLLVSSLLPSGPAMAHVFTKLDGNDSRGKLDLRSASVSHAPTSVVHRISTYGAWTPRSLGNDSFFVIQIDKNNDRRYERCAFIFYTNRLRGSLSNCRAQFIRYLPVAKLSATSARVTVPKSETGGVYWWGAVSLWDGPHPCARGCVDFSPNRFPDILHDLKPPVVQMSQTTLQVWEVSTTPSFQFPFTVSDADSGMDSWKVLRAPEETGSLTTVASGDGGGAKNPTIIGVPGHQRWFHVEARDRHGNRRIGPERQVLVPFDDDELGPAGVYSSGATIGNDSDAYGGTFTSLAVGESLTYTYTHGGGSCHTLSLIGPGSGDWFVSVIDGNGNSILASNFADQHRQTLFSRQMCADLTIGFEVLSGSGFAVDAILA